MVQLLIFQYWIKEKFDSSLCRKSFQVLLKTLPLTWKNLVLLFTYRNSVAFFSSIQVLYSCFQIGIKPNDNKHCVMPDIVPCHYVGPESNSWFQINLKCCFSTFESSHYSSKKVPRSTNCKQWNHSKSKFPKKVLQPAFKKAKINVDISLLGTLGN